VVTGDYRDGCSLALLSGQALSLLCVGSAYWNVNEQNRKVSALGELTFYWEKQTQQQQNQMNIY
jgi:hypothetical protein